MQLARAAHRFHPFRSPLLRDVSNTTGTVTAPAAVTVRRICSDSPAGVGNSRQCSGLSVDCQSAQDTGLTELMEEKKKLSASILQEKDRLRKLTLVQLYRKKNDLSSLDSLTKKWRSAAQKLLCDLRDFMSNSAGAGEPKPTLKDIICHYQIEPSLILYDSENDTFGA